MSSAPGTPRRRLRRFGLGLVAALLTVAGLSLLTNRLTSARATPPPGLRFVLADDVPTRIRSWGSTGGEIVLVHGAAETADTWEQVAAELAADHRVWAFDLNGWGYTRRVPPFTLDHQVRQLLGLIRALRLRRPVLVGHSAGAAVVAAAALRQPDAVGAVMLLDGDALDTGAGPPPAARYLLRPPYRTTLLRLALRSDALIRALYRSQCGPRCPELDEAGVQAWRRPLQVPGAEAALWAMAATGGPGLSAQRLSELARLPIPKAVVFGAQDDLFPSGTPAQTAQRIGAPPPLLIPDAHHLTLISDPHPVAAAISTLTRRVGPEPAGSVPSS